MLNHKYFISAFSTGGYLLRWLLAVLFYKDGSGNTKYKSKSSLFTKSVNFFSEWNVIW
jgi:hypothetical protein